MIEIKVSILPFGDSKKRRELGRMYISNTGDHPQRPEYGHYRVDHDGGNFIIRDYLRATGFWGLVRLAINEYLG